MLSRFDKSNYIEPISYTDFTYQVSLIESAILDSANISATKICETSAGILTEAAFSDYAKNAKEQVAKWLKQIQELVSRFCEGLRQKVESSNAGKKMWLNKNREKLNSSTGHGIVVSERILSTIPLIDVKGEISHLQEMFSSRGDLPEMTPILKRAQIARLLKSFHGDPENQKDIKDFVRRQIGGLTKKANTVDGKVVGLNLERVMTYISDTEAEIHKFSRFINSLDINAIMSKDNDEAQTIHAALGEIGSIISIMRIITGEYMALSEHMFSVCKQIVGNTEPIAS